MPKNNPKVDGYWMHRDVEAMAEIAGCAPVFLDADLSE